MNSNIDKFIIKPLSFQYIDRYYELRFHQCKLIQIVGESAIGKSLLAQDFKRYLGAINKSDDALFIDSLTTGSLDALKVRKYKYVVIDNADIIITQELDEFICNEMLTSNYTYWIIIGRKRYLCSADNFVICTLNRELKDNRKYITVKRSTVADEMERA